MVTLLNPSVCVLVISRRLDKGFSTRIELVRELFFVFLTRGEDFCGKGPLRRSSNY